MSRKNKSTATYLPNYAPDGGAAAGAAPQSNIVNTNISPKVLDHYLQDRSISYFTEQDTHDSLSYTYSILCKLKSILERISYESRQCSPIEFFESSILMQLAVNNLIILKNHSTELGGKVKNLLFLNDKNGLELISHIDRDTLAHVLNLEYFYKSHTGISLGQQPIYEYWYEQVFAEDSIFDRITMILQENISSHTSGQSSGSSLDSSDPVFDCYYNTKTSGLPKIIGAIISNSHNKFDYQKSFNNKGDSVLQLLKFNIDIALRAKEDDSYESLIMYIHSIQASGNCAKILKLISYEVPESIKSALPLLISIRNKFAHASNIESLSRIKDKDLTITEILETLSSNLSTIEEAHISHESIKIEFIEDIPASNEEISEFTINTKKPKKSNSFTREEEERLIADAQLLANEEFDLIKQIKSEILQNSRIGIELYKLSTRALSIDLFQYIYNLVLNDCFDINQTIKISHKPLALNARSKHGKTPLEIKRMEFEELLQGNFKIEGQEVETEILPLNLIIYLSQKTNDSRYEELISKILIENAIDNIYIEKLDVLTNPLLMFMFGENKVAEKILKYSRKYYEVFCKSLISEFKSSLMNPETKIFKLLERLTDNIAIKIAQIPIIGENQELFEYFYSNSKKLFNIPNSIFLEDIFSYALVFNKKGILEFLHSQNFFIKEIISEKGLNPIHAACKTGYLETVKFLINIGADVNKISWEGFRPLEYALFFNRINIAKYFLSIEEIDYSASQYINFAFSLSQNEKSDSFLRELITKKGIDVNKKGADGCPPIIYAAALNNIMIGKILLSHPDINVHATLSDGQSALTIAAGEGNIEFIKLLLSRHDTKVNHKTNKGYTALMIAAEEGHFDAVKTLLEDDRVDVNARLENGEIALGMAINREYINIFELLINSDKVDINQADIFLRVLQMDEGPYQEKLIDLILSRNDFNMDNIPSKACIDGAIRVINIPAFICAAKYCPKIEGNKYAMKKLFEKQSGKKIVKQIFDYCGGVSSEFNILLDRLIQVKLELDMLEDVTELDHINLSGEAFNPIEE